MALEKAFSIKAKPPAIWDALTGELAVADDASYRVERAITNELLELEVHLHSGIRALLTYRLIAKDDHTEVVATMEPQGLRYAMFKVITLGRGDTNYELVLVQGLANLKAAVEGTTAPAADLDAGGGAGQP